MFTDWILSLFRPRIRHPLFPDLPAVPAAFAQGELTAIAGTTDELARAAFRGVHARRAVFVLTSPGRFLSDADRDELWRLFQVPVYALLVDEDGCVVAWECEAHDGLHVDDRAKSGACACGRPGVKLMLLAG